MRLYLVVPLLLFLASCDDTMEPVPLPAQGRLLRPVRFNRPGHFVAMSSPNADIYFVRDISPNLESGLWRWVGKNPTLRFNVPAADGLSFTMDFTIPEVTMRETGPVTITYSVNGHLLATERYANAGEQHFKRPIPAALIRSNGETTFSAQVDKTWHGRSGGRDVELGFILVRAGFVQ